MNIQLAKHVIADHIRAMVFLLHDGILPGHTGREYVLRRIIRRATLYGRKLGYDAPFLHTLVQPTVAPYESTYPSLPQHVSTYEAIILNEERVFDQVLSRGLRLIQKHGDGWATPQFAFQLQDTYGFPFELAQILANEQGTSIDTPSFDRLVQESKRAGHLGLHTVSSGPSTPVKESTLFIYDSVQPLESKVQAVDRAPDGTSVWISFPETCFYPESGGQVGDSGYLAYGKTHLPVHDTQRRGNAIFLKIVPSTEIPSMGDTCIQHVDVPRRQKIAQHHTATHLLLAGLRHTLGSHVVQAGSRVESHRLRFDFTHHQALTHEELSSVSEWINGEIANNAPVTASVQPLATAMASGAMATFKEKYDDSVRVLDIGSVSKELCGGTHVNETSHLIAFRILSEKSIAAGIRRIEAVVGMGAMNWYIKQTHTFQSLAHSLKVPFAQLDQRIQSLIYQSQRQTIEIGHFQHFLIQFMKKQDPSLIIHSSIGPSLLIWQIPSAIGSMGFLRQLISEIDSETPIIVYSGQSLVIHCRSPWSAKRLARTATTIVKSCSGGGSDTLAQCKLNDHAWEHISIETGKVYGRAFLHRLKPRFLN